ncbi:MAG: hypothetical protein K8T20_07575 [Planctomycetes bacterium]|nr:hypothetical protein [Planctomycetota bacterium]
MNAEDRKSRLGGAEGTPAPAPAAGWKIFSWSNLIRLIIALAMALLVGGGICLVASRRTDRAWSAYEIRRAEERKSVMARWGARPSLVAPVEPGNAWDEYVKAYEALVALPESDHKFLNEAAEGAASAENDARADELLGRCALILGTVRRGAARAEATSPWPVDRPLPSPLNSLPGARYAGRLLRLSVRRRFAEGDTAGAVSDAAVGLQASLDMMRGPSLIHLLIGHAMAIAMASEMRSILVSPKCTPETASALGELARSADARMPAYSEAMAAEKLIGLAGLEEGFKDGTVNTGPSTWLQGITYRGTVCAADGAYGRLLSDIRRLEILPWPEGQAAYKEVADRRLDPGAMIIDLLKPALQAGEGSHRQVRARLRLLSVAGRVRAGETPGGADWPLDPFDLAPMRFRQIETGTELWSVWKDSVESRAGDWDDPDKSGGDCRLLVPK